MKRKNKLADYLHVVTMGMMGLLLVVSCSDKGEAVKLEEVGIPGNTVISVEGDKQQMLRNPLNGWVLYGTVNPPATFWSDYDRLQVSGLENPVKIEDFASTLYIRLSWTALNPEENVYGWDTNEQLKSMIANAKQRKMKLAFRVVVDSRDKAEDFTPKYVKDAGTQGYVTQTGSRTVWSPYPDDPIFQEKYSKFIAAFAAKFNDPDLVEFIDGFGLGKWGEAHSMNYINASNREQVFKWVVDLYAKEFTKIPLAVNYHRLIALPKDWGAADAQSEPLLNYAFSKGYILRQDAFGMSGYYQSWEKAFAAKWRYKLPNIMEGGWVTAIHPYTTDVKAYKTIGDVRRGEFEDSKEAGVNMMDFRIGETQSWFKETFNLVKQFISEGGYRLYPDRVSLPKEVKKGSEISIEHRWVNLGWGYCPNNMLQWNYKYKVALALLDPTTKEVEKLFLDSDSDPSKWLKGKPITYLLKPNMQGVTPGEYMWAIAIVDTTKENKPGIQLATKGETTEDGWLLLSSVKVQ